MLHQINKNQTDKIKPSFKIVRIKPFHSSADNLEMNKLIIESIDIKSEWKLEISSVLSNFTSDESCAGFYWSKWKNETQWTTKTTLFELPKCLIIRMMRFQTDDSYMRQVYMKNDKFIDFPLKELDLSKYCDPDVKIDNCKYDLYRVIHHTGSVDAGHYYTTIKNDISSDDWFMFNGKDNSIKIYDYCMITSDNFISYFH